MSNHRVVSPWCTKALSFIELTVDNINSWGFNASLARYRFVRNFLWQKCWDSRKRAHFSAFERFSTLCHTLLVRVGGFLRMRYCLVVFRFSLQFVA
jgi:hypothetical protein